MFALGQHLVLSHVVRLRGDHTLSLLMEKIRRGGLHLKIGGVTLTL